MRVSIKIVFLYSLVTISNVTSRTFNKRGFVRIGFSFIFKTFKDFYHRYMSDINEYTYYGIIQISKEKNALKIVSGLKKKP